MGVVTDTFRFTGAGEDFGPRGSGLVILHTTESVATRNTVADAILVARWQDRDDVLGSYNRLIATDGVLSCVPDDHASGGVNPASDFFDPKPWLFKMLPSEMVRNPNMVALQLAAVGQRAFFDANGWPAGIIDGYARSIIEEERRTGINMVVANHADFQPGNRTDAGAIAIDLVMKRYAELTAPKEDPMVIAELRAELAEVRAKALRRAERIEQLENRVALLREEISKLETELAQEGPSAESFELLQARLARVKEMVGQMAAEIEEV
jgi:hypothetical protein